MHGGDFLVQVLRAHGVQHLFTLCGGHISPILTSANRCGIRVVDVRDEATAVFAAWVDALVHCFSLLFFFDFSAASSDLTLSCSSSSSL